MRLTANLLTYALCTAGLPAAATEDYGATVTRVLQASEMEKLSIDQTGSDHNAYGRPGWLGYAGRSYCLDNLIYAKWTTWEVDLVMPDGTILPVADGSFEKKLNFRYGTTRVAVVSGLTGSDEREGLTIDIAYPDDGPHAQTRAHMFLRPCIPDEL